MPRSAYVYILASGRNGTLYIGVTADLVRRVHQHRLGNAAGFTHQHSVHQLVYFECFDDIAHAIEREKRLKNWNRMWKLRLIENHNPEWRDLYRTIL